MKNLLFISFSLLLTALVNAKVVWENTTQEYKATFEDTKTEAIFRFTNTGSKPVKVIKIHTSCGCTATTPPRAQPYQPGETGEVIAVFSYGDRTGRQTKNITAEIAEVETDGTVGTPTPHQLTLTVDIPVVLQVEPNFLFWQPGEGAVAKTARVTVGDGIPLEVKDIRVGDPNISARFKTITPNKQYEIELTPNEEATKKGSFGLILIETSLQNRNFTLFFNVPPAQKDQNAQAGMNDIFSQPVLITVPEDVPAKAAN